MKFIIVNTTNTLCGSEKIHPVLLRKYPGAVVWYREEKQIGGELGALGAKISKLERVKEEVGPYLVPCMILDVDE